LFKDLRNKCMLWYVILYLERYTMHASLIRIQIINYEFRLN